MDLSRKMSAEALATLLAQPALPAPPGVTANFDNPPKSNTIAWVVTTLCLGTATICLFLRLSARVWLEKKMCAEEVLMICAYGAYCGTAYAAYALIYSPGYFVHTWNLRNKDLIRPLYLILVYGCCYSAVLPLIKTAILLDWCRIFVHFNRTQNPFWWGCIAIICLQCLWGAVCIILLNLQCKPHEAIWKFYLPSTCYSLPDVMLTSASVQVATDIIMFVLPQRTIWGLRINWQKKIGVSIIFSVGILASIAACFRLAHTVSFAKSSDTIYRIGPLLFWACAEMTCGFLIFSMPCLSKLIMESGLPRRVKSSLGFSPKSSQPSHETSDPPFPSARSSRLGSHPMKPPLDIDAFWPGIEEGDVNIQTPESRAFKESSPCP